MIQLPENNDELGYFFRMKKSLNILVEIAHLNGGCEKGRLIAKRIRLQDKALRKTSCFQPMLRSVLVGRDDYGGRSRIDADAIEGSKPLANIEIADEPRKNKRNKKGHSQ